MGRIVAWMLFFFVMYILSNGSAIKYYQILFTSGPTDAPTSAKQPAQKSSSDKPAQNEWDDGGDVKDWSDSGSDLQTGDETFDFSSFFG